MLLLRNIFLSCLIGSFCISSNARAGLSGFSSANPYTHEEEILSIDTPPLSILNYRQEMRNNVSALSKYAKGLNPNFIIMVHDGKDLLEKGIWEYHLQGYNRARQLGYDANDPTFLARIKTLSPALKSVGTPAHNYRKHIDAVVLNNYFCQPHQYQLPKDLQLISIDKCADNRQLNQAITQSVQQHALLYNVFDAKAPFNNINTPLIINENARNIFDIKQAENIVFLLDTSLYADKEALIKSIRNSNYDVIIIPAFIRGVAFTKNEVHSLKFKKNGTRRLIIAALNISETDDSQYYWQSGWKIGAPSWLKRLSFVDKEGILVEYWHPEWKNIIAKYFKGIVDLGFDGAFLTGLENHRYFEHQTPLE